MILYATKQTIDRLKLPVLDSLPPDMADSARMLLARDHAFPLWMWGGKLFYFDGRKCLQCVNFATKFTLFLFDLKVGDANSIGQYISEYLLDLFADDPEMTRCLLRMFQLDQFFTFAPLKDKSIIATLNHTQTDYAFDGDRFWDYIQDGILYTRKINQDVNFNHLFTHKAAGKKDFYYPAEFYREQVVSHFSDSAKSYK